MRLKIIRIIVILAFVSIAMSLFYVQAIKGRYYFRLSTNNRIRVVPTEGWRGAIYDRNGVAIAKNRISYNVMITPQAIEDFDRLFDFLSHVLEVDRKKLVKNYKAKKHTPFAPVMLAQDIEQQKAIVLEENRYQFPSMFVDENFKRTYPLQENSAHVLGYVGKVNRSSIKRYKEYGYSPLSVVGQSGIEEYYDLNLRGGAGGLQIEVNSRGQQVRLLSIKDSSRGKDIRLTIDSRIQELAKKYLDGHRGAIVMMDASNGEILSMTSSPAFNPNHIVDPKLRDKTGNMYQNQHSPLMNRAISGRFPPGSVFKIPVAICGLDSKKIKKNSTFHCRGYHEIGNIRFGCTYPHGDQNLIESIAHSCNVYYYRLGAILGADLLTEYALRFGLGQLTHVDLPYEAQGNIPNQKQGLLSKKRPWYKGDTLNFSIGQGDVLTTPLQLTQMMSTIANDGIEVRPHLIKAIGGVEVDTFKMQKDIGIKKEFFEIVKRGMRATVRDYTGTAHELNNNKVYVAGKTGTAQSSPNKEHHAWFSGYIKGDDRNISFCVFLEHGGSSHNAVAVTRQLLLHMNRDGLI